MARFKEIHRKLKSTRAPGDIARLLNTCLKFTQADLSAATGAHGRTVAGWLGKEAQAPGNNDHKERLHQLKALIDVVSEDGTIAGDIVDWFRDPNRNLGYLTPLELVAEGRWREVGSGLCEEAGIPKGAWPEAFQAKTFSPRRKR